MSTKKTTAEAEATAATAEAGTRATAAVTAPQTAAESVAYMGPDIKNVVINGTVYIGELPAALKKQIEEVPALKGLLVPVSKLASAGVAISTKETALNNLYTAVSIKLREKQE